jgi:hypothetical protein
MKYTATTEKWKEMWQPDLNSIVTLRDRKTSIRHRFKVDAINFGTKRGIEMKLRKLK